MNENQNQIDTLNNSFCKVLNSHGFAFHYSVLRKAEELYEKGRSAWRFVASEYPVSVNGFDTRIDFILKYREQEKYLIAECKRANPAFSNWCFVRTPYQVADSNSVSIYTETIELLENKSLLTDGEFLNNTDQLYHLGFEIKTGLKGESETKSRGAIEEASTQVCKGLNGFTEEFKKHGKYVLKGSKTKVKLIPVIFSTAKIFVSKIDIGNANIENGEIKPDGINLEERKWIWLQYNLSPGLKHNLPSFGTIPKDFSDILTRAYTRSIAIVNVSGIEQFLGIDW